MVLYRGVYSGMWFYIGGCTEGCGSIWGGVQRDVVLYRGCTEGCGSI